MHTNGQHFQHTIAKDIKISGPGIHTGHLVNMLIRPAAPNTGINFQRTDIESRPIVKADVDNVVMTNRSTTIESGGARINTIEHLLAAFVGMGVDNVLIELDGDEVPILDGSAQPFVEAIEKAGVEKQDAPKIYYNIEHNISFVDEERQVEMVAMPFHEYRVNALIDFNSPILGTQHASLKDIKNFKDQIAPCRTFCFFHELEWLLDNDLIKGGDRNNAVVVVDKPVTEKQITKLKSHFPDIEIPTGQGYLNNASLRFANEPARHKLLDVIGDLALVGYAFNAHIIASKPGHAANVKFAKKLKEHIKKVKLKGEVPVYDPEKPPLYDVHAIEKLLPHRYPFLMIDKIIELTDTKVVGIKNVTYNEPFFQGHFPGNCVMPGVLLAEALAQCGGILAIPKDTEDRYDTYFLKIDNCKFKQKVVPGDTLVLSMELKSPIRRGIVEMKGIVYVANKIVAEAELVAQIVKRPKHDD